MEEWARDYVKKTLNAQRGVGRAFSVLLHVFLQKPPPLEQDTVQHIFEFGPQVRLALLQFLVGLARYYGIT